jgi:hypothetical protein
MAKLDIGQAVYKFLSDKEFREIEVNREEDTRFGKIYSCGIQVYEHGDSSAILKRNEVTGEISHFTGDNIDLREELSKYVKRAKVGKGILEVYDDFCACRKVLIPFKPSLPVDIKIYVEETKGKAVMRRVRGKIVSVKSILETVETGGKKVLTFKETLVCECGSSSTKSGTLATVAIYEYGKQYHVTVGLSVKPPRLGKGEALSMTEFGYFRPIKLTLGDREVLIDGNGVYDTEYTVLAEFTPKGMVKTSELVGEDRKFIEELVSYIAPMRKLIAPAGSVEPFKVTLLDK